MAGFGGAQILTTRHINRIESHESTESGNYSSNLGDQTLSFSCHLERVHSFWVSISFVVGRHFELQTYWFCLKFLFAECMLKNYIEETKAFEGHHD